MAARAIWKGVIDLGDLQVPVKFYSAVEDRNVHFHLLHDQDHVRLKQQMVNPVSERPVPRDQTRKGLEIERDRFVIFNEDELEQLTPEASRTIEIRQFVDPALINHQWYVRPYWLGPDEKPEEYFALAKALLEEQQEGVAVWTMRKKRYLGALRAEGGYLCMITLRNAAEVISVEQLDAPQGRQLQPRERAMADQLVAALQDEFDPQQYQDEYRQRVMQLIEAKRRGEPYEPEPDEETPESDDLAASLQASLKSLKR